MALLAKSICEEVLHKHSLEVMVALFPYPSSQEKVDSNYDKFVCCLRMTHSVEDVNSLCESLSDKFLFNPKVLADRKQQLAYNTKQMLVLFWTRTYHLIQKYDPKSAVFNDLLLPDLLTILDESFMPILLVNQINQVLDAVKKVKKVTLLKYIFAPVILDDVIDAPDELDLEESDLCGKEGSHNIKDQAISKANDGKNAYRYFILEFMKFNLKDEIKLFCEKLHNEINGETNETILQTLLIKLWMKIYCYMKPKESCCDEGYIHSSELLVEAINVFNEMLDETFSGDDCFSGFGRSHSGYLPFTSWFTRFYYATIIKNFGWWRNNCGKCMACLDCCCYPTCSALTLVFPIVGSLASLLSIIYFIFFLFPGK